MVSGGIVVIEELVLNSEAFMKPNRSGTGNQYKVSEKKCVFLVLGVFFLKIDLK